MLLKVYTIHDSKTEAYLKPFYAATDAEAVRTFADAINDNNSPFHRHAEDYTLFGIGTFEDTQGLLDSLPHWPLGCAITFLNED